MSRIDISKISLAKKDIQHSNKQLVNNSAAGFPPFLRGTKTTMFLKEPWKTTDTDSNTNNIYIESFSSTENNIEEEVTKILFAGLQVVKTKLNEGFKIDDITPNLVFVWKSEHSFFEEISKIRAARIVWAKLIKNFNPKQPESLALQSKYTIDNNSLENESESNSITTTTLKTLIGVLAGSEFIDINSSSATHQFLANEIGITKTVDPWAGSFELEKRTEEIAKKAWSIIQDLEKTN